MCLWIAMRNAAFWRHYAVWLACGADPADWPPHERLIRAVYGF